MCKTIVESGLERPYLASSLNASPYWAKFAEARGSVEGADGLRGKKRNVSRGKQLALEFRL